MKQGNWGAENEILFSELTETDRDIYIL